MMVPDPWSLYRWRTVVFRRWAVVVRQWSVMVWRWSLYRWSLYRWSLKRWSLYRCRSGGGPAAVRWWYGGGPVMVRWCCHCIFVYVMLSLYLSLYRWWCPGTGGGAPARYGPVFKCSPKGFPTIVSCDLELNNFILQNEGTLFSTDYPKPIREATGQECVLFSSGQHHKTLRIIVMNFIRSSHISPHLVSYIDKLSTIIMQPWKEDKKIKEIVFYKESQSFMLYYFLKRVLDIDIGDEKATMIHEDMFTIFSKGYSYIPGRTQARVDKARTRIRENLALIIRERIKQNKFQLKAEWNEEDTVTVVLSLLLGNFEPNSSLMTLVLYFVARSPRAILELKAEHEKMKVPLSLLEDYRGMEFTMKVINETLRCGSVSKYLYRRALKDVTYNGFLIPSGWRVIPFLTGTHLNPSLHENPYEFNPWRWDYKETKKKVLPFGGGPKICPGAEFAKHAVAVFLHYFVLNFNWKVTDDDRSVLQPFMESEKELILEIEPASME